MHKVITNWILMLPFRFYVLAIYCLLSGIMQALSPQFLIHDTYRTSRSFIFPQPAYQSLAVSQNFLQNFISCKSGTTQSIVQATGLFQNSLPNCHMAGYFLLNCKNKLTIKGDAVSGNFDRDIRAEWLNLPADFNGILAISPRQKQSGVLLTYNYSIGHWFSIDFFKYAWLTVSMPILAVENSLHLQQKIIQAGTSTSCQPDTSANTIIEAFNQPAWAFGKIAPQNIKKVAVAELRCDLGVTMPTHEEYLLLAYAGLIIPTASKQKPNYLFNTFVGINKHTGFSLGVRMEAPVYYFCSGCPLYMFFHIENLYYLPNTQWRMLDLKSCSGATGFAADLPIPNRQWSRYLLLRKPGQLTSTPGINILTQYVRVHPYSTVNLSVGLKINYYNCYLETGYNLWARDREKLCFVHPNCETGRLSFEHYGIAGSLPGSSAHTSTISCLGPDDTKFRHICKEDVSLASGSFPGGCAQQVHMLIGCQTGTNNSYMLAVGGFYEFPHKTNTVFSCWGLWCNIGHQF